MHIFIQKSYVNYIVLFGNRGYFFFECGGAAAVLVVSMKVGGQVRHTLNT